MMLSIDPLSAQLAEKLDGEENTELLQKAICFAGERFCSQVPRHILASISPRTSLFSECFPLHWQLVKLSSCFALLIYNLVVFQILERTKEVEANGGMMTRNQERRRTPGGVFFSVFHSP